MRSFIFTGAAALSMLAMPMTLSAQPMDPGSAPDNKATAPAMTPDQQKMYDALPSDQQSYYQTLTPQQQTGYWALTPDQRGMIYKMTPDQRAKAWQSIATQMQGQTPPTPAGQANPPGEGMPTASVPDPQSAGQSAPPAMPADQSDQGASNKGAMTPPPATEMNKQYPMCSKTVHDSCRNRGGK